MSRQNLLTLLFLVFAIPAFTQNFSNYTLSTSYNDHFSDFIEVSGSYYISGAQGDPQYNARQLRSFMVKLSKDGQQATLTHLDTMGTNRMIWTTVWYKNHFYNIYTENYFRDTNRLCIVKRDTNLNLIAKKSFPDSENFLMQIDGNYKMKDSLLQLNINYRKSTTNSKLLTALATINLNSMQLEDMQYFKHEYFLDDFLKKNDKYYFVTSHFDSIYYSKLIVEYDTSFNIIDTHYIDKPYLFGNSNIRIYQDSLFLISGEGVNLSQSNINYTFELQLHVFDRGFNRKAYRSFMYLDSSIVNLRAGYIKNIVKNKNNQYFTGSYVEEYYQDTLPNGGVFIVKLDSNLNTIWKKHIPGNANHILGRLHPTEDGGVVMSIIENPENPGGDSDALFVKLGPNGQYNFVKSISLNNNLLVELFPNPVHSELNVHLINEKDNIEIFSIYDINGKLVTKERVNSNRKKINVSFLLEGLYILTGKTTNGTIFRKKFIKQ